MVNVNISQRQSSTCGQPGYLTVTLANGVLTDSQQRIGYIASNYQFQFDGPPQAGAIYTAGFSVLSNSSLALGSSAVFYQCYSGGFYNLYDRHWAAQCEPVLLDIIPCSSTSQAGVGQKTDGQPTGTGAVSQTSDGQPQATTVGSKPVSQISDGQIQATTVAPKPVTQISDGQIQVPTRAPVSQISDGQIQATTAVPKTTSRAPVSQISDGQIQATSASKKPTSSAAVVTQIGDGQIQAPNATTTPVPFTGAANTITMASSFAAVIIGAIAILLL
jgi:hypothetical protein